MSNKGEMTCQVCAGKMDQTDLELKPCSCGYEICLWCWHHVMEIAEGKKSEGRCPACRTVYDKERILGNTANLERRVENSGQKHRTQKEKSKSSEKRIDLVTSTAITDNVCSDKSDLRVIQRNVVYIPAIQAHLANEETLRRKNFLGQYGKILNICIGRAVTVDPKVSPNNLRSVYATFSKVAEALHCIRVVDGFTLDGLSLKATFGAAKYCDLWLNKKTCNKKNCFLLHRNGKQEDICKKAEVLTASKSKLLEEGVTSNRPLRSGSYLPPPLEDYRSDGFPKEKHLIQGSDGSTKRTWDLPFNQNNSCDTQQISQSSIGRLVTASTAVTQASSGHPQILAGPLLPSACIDSYGPYQSRQNVPSDIQICTSKNYDQHFIDDFHKSSTPAYSEYSAEYDRETAGTFSQSSSLSSNDDSFYGNTAFHMNVNMEWPLTSLVDCIVKSAAIKKNSMDSSSALDQETKPSNAEIECPDGKEIPFLSIKERPCLSLKNVTLKAESEATTIEPSHGPSVSNMDIRSNITAPVHDTVDTDSEKCKAKVEGLSISLSEINSESVESRIFSDSNLPDLYSLEEMFGNMKGCSAPLNSFFRNRNESQFSFARMDQPDQGNGSVLLLTGDRSLEKSPELLDSMLDDDIFVNVSLNGCIRSIVSNSEDLSCSIYSAASELAMESNIMNLPSTGGCFFPPSNAHELIATTGLHSQEASSTTKYFYDSSLHRPPALPYVPKWLPPPAAVSVHSNNSNQTDFLEINHRHKLKIGYGSYTKNGRSSIDLVGPEVSLQNTVKKYHGPCIWALNSQ